MIKIKIHTNITKNNKTNIQQQIKKVAKSKEKIYKNKKIIICK